MWKTIYDKMPETLDFMWVSSIFIRSGFTDSGFIIAYRFYEIYISFHNVGLQVLFLTKKDGSGEFDAYLVVDKTAKKIKFEFPTKK